MATKLQRKRHSAMVMASFRAAQARRRKIADDFRARLMAEVGPGASIAREALIDTAVSAYVEISETSARFLHCRASGDSLARLSIARGQLTRTLRLLGVAPNNAADDADTPPRGGIQDYLARSERTDGGTDNA